MITKLRPVFSTMLILAVVLAVCGIADARRGDPPKSMTSKAASINEVPVLELEAVNRAALLAEDEARAAAGPGPLRIAAPSDVKITPAEDGVWETLPDGGRLWRLRIHAPKATDLNFGFTRYRLPPGATLHIVSGNVDYFEGPFTSDDNKAHGELWTPVVPGERAVVELYVPPAPVFEPELQLGRIGRGYRDFLGLDRGPEKQGSCNIDVVCPEGDAWRDEIRSVALYTFTVPLGTGICTGTLIRDVPNTFTPYLLSAYHCGVDTANDQTVVAYWNFESSSCGDLDEWPPPSQPSQNGSTFRASREDNDMLLLELDDEHVVATHRFLPSADFYRGHFPGDPITPGVIEHTLTRDDRLDRLDILLCAEDVHGIESVLLGVVYHLNHPLHGRLGPVVIEDDGKQGVLFQRLLRVRTDGPGRQRGRQTQ